ncbi:D-galactonate dehydratase family protein [candidate division KSB1 bacterium]|nr:D-galactonate dehydratase family protein [candidate division KSB1 bacterium]
MKITSAKVIVTSPSRNFVTLKIETDEGIYGLGDATLNGREKAVVAYLEEHCIPMLIGRDPFQIEDSWYLFYRGAYWRRGPVTMTAVAAIDVALWDIKGKALNTPLYNLIGGKSREKVMVYAHANGKDIEATLGAVGREIDKGFIAVRAQTGIPGIIDTYGVPKGDAPYEPAVRGLAQESFWETEKYMNHVPKLFKRLRETYGEDVHLLHDVHHRCTPIEAARLARELEPYHLFWLEDAVAGELQEGLRLIRNHSTTPIAIGEVFNTIYDYSALMVEQLFDYIRMPIGHGGGITHLLKVAAFGSVYHIKTGFHGPTDLSPVTMAAALHFDLAINNFGIQEYMPHQAIVNDVFKINYKFDKGYMIIDDSPGLGVDIDEAKAVKYPYERAYLPINRKTDGTMFHW